MQVLHEVLVGGEGHTELGAVIKAGVAGEFAELRESEWDMLRNRQARRTERKDVPACCYVVSSSCQLDLGMS